VFLVQQVIGSAAARLAVVVAQPVTELPADSTETRAGMARTVRYLRARGGTPGATAGPDRRGTARSGSAFGAARVKVTPRFHGAAQVTVRAA
jgi:hypothetical protein